MFSNKTIVKQDKEETKYNKGSQNVPIDTDLDRGMVWGTKKQKIYIYPKITTSDETQKGKEGT